MQRERLTEDIYVFRSDLYVQVTAGLVMTSVGSVLIDTLMYPEETLQIKRFVEQRLGTHVRYVINTHHHADHTMGTCFFPDAQVIGHRLCRELLDTRGRESIEKMREFAGEKDATELVLPSIVFDEKMTLTVGNKTLEMWSSPGHSDDCIACLAQEDDILFASDTVMALPTFVDGRYGELVASIKRLQGHPYEAIVQGHGEVILKGEAKQKLADDLDYLACLKEKVTACLMTDPVSADKMVDLVTLEECGKERVLLHGAAEQLHQSNVMALASAIQADALTQPRTL
jgi:glyoxylase-like metal-dependent hydrolase (beta-lactamase superfamily II)